MVPKKRQSKRQTLQNKYKIKKRTKEHHRRIKKGAIVNFKKKAKTTDHIPNDWPYKEDLLKEIQNAKERMEEVKLRQKEKRKEEIANRRKGLTSMDIEGEPQRPLINIKPFDESAHDSNNDDASGHDVKNTNLGQNSRRAYLKELRKVVEGADVILHVLDARDPLGTKSDSIEEMVMSHSGKRLVYILNKADLVPRDILIRWLTYLRKSYPTLPFKSNTQYQKGNLGSMSGKVNKQQMTALSSNQAIGAEELIGLLKNYARSGDTKSIITVGCVGFPNVGKSSLINSLLRTRAVGVSSTPGFTKQTQEVILDKNIRLMDSPGIVFADGDSAVTTLRNCVHVESLEDVLTPIQAILDKCPSTYLMQLYNIPKFEDKNIQSFLALIARSTGKLKKGGIPNIDAAARTILHDWNEGKIKYYMTPPTTTMTSSTTSSSITSSNTGKDGEMIVMSEYSTEMDMSTIDDVDIRVLNQLEVAVEQDTDNSTPYIPLNESDIHFGDYTNTTTNNNNNNMGESNSSDMMTDDVTNGGRQSSDKKKKTGIMKLSKKLIAANANDMMDAATKDTLSVHGTRKQARHDDSGSEIRSISGTIISHASYSGGVLSRKQDILQTGEATPAVDPRKVQKSMKKKAEKLSRRTTDKSDGNATMETQDQPYDFKTDFYR